MDGGSSGLCLEEQSLRNILRGRSLGLDFNGQAQAQRKCRDPPSPSIQSDGVLAEDSAVSDRSSTIVAEVLLELNLTIQVCKKVDVNIDSSKIDVTRDTERGPDIGTYSGIKDPGRVSVLNEDVSYSDGKAMVGKEDHDTVTGGKDVHKGDGRRVDAVHEVTADHVRPDLDQGQYPDIVTYADADGDTDTDVNMHWITSEQPRIPFPKRSEWFARQMLSSQSFLKKYLTQTSIIPPAAVRITRHIVCNEATTAYLLLDLELDLIEAYAKYKTFKLESRVHDIDIITDVTCIGSDLRSNLDLEFETDKGLNVEAGSGFEFVMRLPGTRKDIWMSQRLKESEEVQGLESLIWVLRGYIDVLSAWVLLEEQHNRWEEDSGG